MPTVPTAADHLAAVVAAAVKIHRDAFAALLKDGVAPNPEVIGLATQMDTALIAYQVAKAAAMGAPVNQIIAAAQLSLDEGNAEAAGQALRVLSMVLGFTDVGDRADEIERMIRNLRQEVVLAWAIDRFGEIAEPANPIERAERLLEEAIELHQAVNEERPNAKALEAARARAHEIVDHVYSKPPGDVRQEIGGVAITLMAMAQVASVSVADAETDELGRILFTPKETFVARHKRKIESGLARPKDTDNG